MIFGSSGPDGPDGPDQDIIINNFKRVCCNQCGPVLDRVWLQHCQCH